MLYNPPGYRPGFAQPGPLPQQGGFGAQAFPPPPPPRFVGPPARGGGFPPITIQGGNSGGFAQPQALPGARVGGFKGLPGPGLSQPGPLPGYAAGGVATGPSLVGEQGPEVIYPTPGGTAVMPIGGSPGQGGPGSAPPPPPLQYGGRDQFGNLVNAPQANRVPGPGEMKNTFIGPPNRMPATKYIDPATGKYYDNRGPGGYFKGGANVPWNKPEGAFEALYKWQKSAGLPTTYSWEETQAKQAEARASEQARYDSGQMSPYERLWWENYLAEMQNGFGDPNNPMMQLVNQASQQAGFDPESGAPQSYIPYLQALLAQYPGEFGNYAPPDMGPANYYGFPSIPNESAGWAGESGPFLNGYNSRRF